MSAIPATTNGASHPAVVPSEVGWQFVPQYYTFVNKEPNRLHCFYNKNSTFIHGTEGEDIKPCFGQKVCHGFVLPFTCRAYISLLILCSPLFAGDEMRWGVAWLPRSGARGSRVPARRISTLNSLLFSFTNGLFYSFFSLHYAPDTLLWRVCLHSGRLNGIWRPAGCFSAVSRVAFKSFHRRIPITGFGSASCVIPHFRLHRLAEVAAFDFLLVWRMLLYVFTLKHLPTFQYSCRDDVIASY